MLTNKSIQLGDKDLRRSVSVLTSDLNTNIFYLIVRPSMASSVVAKLHTFFSSSIHYLCVSRVTVVDSVLKCRNWRVECGLERV